MEHRDKIYKYKQLDGTLNGDSFHGCTFESIVFFECNDLKFTQCTFEKCVIMGCNRLAFVFCELNGCSFTSSIHVLTSHDLRFARSKLIKCRIGRSDTDRSRFQTLRFHAATHLFDCSFEKFDGYFVEFNNVNLYECRFSDVTLEIGYLNVVNMSKAAFGKTLLLGVGLDFVTFRACSLYGLAGGTMWRDCQFFNTLMNWNNSGMVSHRLIMTTENHAKIAWASWIRAVRNKHNICWQEAIAAAPWDMVVWAVGEFITWIQPHEFIGELPDILNPECVLEYPVGKELVETYPDYYKGE